MGLDTRVPGDPAALFGVAGWLREALGAQLEASVDTLASVGRLAEGDWRGRSGEAFVASVRRATPGVSELAGAVTSVAATLTRYAGTLAAAQRRMAAVRGEAAAGGLAVVDQVVVDPGGGPDRPSGDLSGLGSVGAVQRHEAALDAFEEHRARRALYVRLSAEVGSVRVELAARVEELDAAYHGLRGAQWLLTAGQIVADTGASLVTGHARQLRDVGAELDQSGRNGLDRLRNDPLANGRHYFDGDWRHYEDMKAQGIGLQRAGTKWQQVGYLGMGTGGLLAGAGVIYDIHNGKDRKQAVVAGSAGFVAGVGVTAGTGALIGTVICPGPGTAVGAVGGAAVAVVAGTTASVFTSGAVDAMFEEGLDAGVALSGGWEATVDTGEALGGAVLDGAEAVGDGLSGVVAGVGSAVQGLGSIGLPGVLSR